MIPVALEYKPFLLLPYTRHVETRLPARWSEMSPEQISSIPDMQHGKMTDAEILTVFLGIDRKIAGKLDSYQTHCIIRNLRYISEPEPFGNFIIKEIAGFKAPGEKLKGVTFGAFIFGDTYYQNYISGKRNDLNKFIASFYTRNEKFDDGLIDKNAEKISKVKSSTREAIAVNYGLIREWLARAYPYVFEKSEEGSKKQTPKGWIDVYDMLVAENLSDHDKIAMTPASTVLRILNYRRKLYLKNGGKV